MLIIRRDKSCQYKLWYLSVAVSCAGRKFTSDLHTTRPPTQSDSYQRLYWHSFLSWWWARCARKALGPTQPRIRWEMVLFPGGKAAEAWHWPPTPSSAEVKERAQLYRYSPSGPSWPVRGWHLPLPLYISCNPEVTWHKFAVISILRRRKRHSGTLCPNV